MKIGHKRELEIYGEVLVSVGVGIREDGIRVIRMNYTKYEIVKII